MNVDVVVPGGAVIGTFTFTATVGDMLARGSTVAANMSLPAGRWQVVTTLMGTGTAAQATQTAQSADTTLGSPGVIASAALNIKAYRPFSAPSQELRAQVHVQRHNGTNWVPYASGLGIAAVPVAGAASTTKRIGVSGFHIYNDWMGPVRSWWQTGMDRVAEAGFNFIRTTFAAPAIVSTASPASPATSWDAYQLGVLDNFYADATSRGLTIVATLGGCPCWASSLVGKSCVGRPGISNASLYPPTNWQDMQDFAKALCDRYALEAVEPYNEPNNAVFGMTGFSDADHVTHHQRLRAGIQASAHPVPFLGMVTSMIDTAWMDRMYTAGIASNMDAMCVHPYPLDMVPSSPSTATPWHQVSLKRPFNGDDTRNLVEALELTRANMTSHGDGAKPIWVTETGIASHVPGPFNNFTAPISEATRTEQLDAVLRQAARVSYLSGFTVFAMTDYPGSGSGYGLCDPQWIRKDGFTTVKNTLTAIRAGAG